MGKFTNMTLKPPRPRWVEPFLKHFARNGVVSWAARRAGIARQHVYWYKRRHPEFAAEFAEAEAEGVEWIEAAAVQAAHAGNATLLMFLLKARKPHVYRDNYRAPKQIPPDPPHHTAESGMSITQRIEKLAFELQRKREAAASHGESEGHDRRHAEDPG